MANPLSKSYDIGTPSAHRFGTEKAERGVGLIRGQEIKAFEGEAEVTA